MPLFAILNLAITIRKVRDVSFDRQSTSSVESLSQVKRDQGNVKPQISKLDTDLKTSSIETDKC